MTDRIAGTGRPAQAGPVVVLDALDYGRTVLLQGAPIAWEPPDHARFLSQLGALLRPDRTLVDVGRLVGHLLDERPDLVEAMGARSRTGYALRTLLADEAITATAVETLRIVGAGDPRPLVVQLPSPGVWLAETARRAGADHEQDADDRENASVYVADWLRAFSDTTVGTVVLDARGGADDEDLGDYGPVRGVADHYRWGLVLRRDEDAQTSSGEARIIPADFWRSGSGAGELAGIVIAQVPDDAAPESVLARRRDLA